MQACVQSKCATADITKHVSTLKYCHTKYGVHKNNMVKSIYYTCALIKMFMHM